MYHPVYRQIEKDIKNDLADGWAILFYPRMEKNQKERDQK